MTSQIVSLEWSVFGLVWFEEPKDLDWGMWQGLLKSLWVRLDSVIWYGIGFDWTYDRFSSSIEEEGTLYIGFMGVALGIWGRRVLRKMRYLEEPIDWLKMIALVGNIVGKAKEVSWNKTSLEMKIFTNFLMHL